MADDVTITFTWGGFFEAVGIIVTAAVVGGALYGLWVMARWGK